MGAPYVGTNGGAKGAVTTKPALRFVGFRGDEYHFGRAHLGQAGLHPPRLGSLGAAGHAPVDTVIFARASRTIWCGPITRMKDKEVGAIISREMGPVPN